MIICFKFTIFARDKSYFTIKLMQ